MPNYTEMVFDVNVDDLKKFATSQLSKFKADLLEKTNAQFIINTEVRMGVFEDELISICERLNPYAVIMGSQGKTTAENILMMLSNPFISQRFKSPATRILLTLGESSITATGGKLKGFGITWTDFKKNR